MEINVQEIMSRMDIQQITHFILYGNGADETYNITYEQWQTEGNILILERLKTLYKDNNRELTNAIDEFNTALTVNSAIFTEIGMKAGARLLFQLLGKND